MSYISEAIDYLNLLEDNSSKAAINSSLIVLLTHMLKCKYQPEYKNKASWVGSIWSAYKNIVSQFPAVGKGALYKIFYLKKVDLNTIYKIAKRDASVETGKNISVFPNDCEWTKEQLTDYDFITDFINNYGNNS